MRTQDFHALLTENIKFQWNNLIQSDADAFDAWHRNCVMKQFIDREGFYEIVDSLQYVFNTEQDYLDFRLAYAPGENDPKYTPLMVKGDPYGLTMSEISDGTNLVSTDLITVSRPVGGGVYDDFRINASTITNVTNKPWQVKTAAFNAVAYNRYLCDTSGGAFTVTLPANPATGTEIVFGNTGTLLVNNLTLGRNGSTMNGSLANTVLSLISPTIITVVCTGTNAWRTFP